MLLGRQRKMKLPIGTLIASVCLAISGCGDKAHSGSVDLPSVVVSPQVIFLDIPEANEGEGGIIAIDVNDDGNKDFIVTKPGHIVAYDYRKGKIWSKKMDIQVTRQSETNGLPGLHGPGVQGADVDGDLETEVLVLTKDNILHILEGATGKVKNKIHLKSPSGTERWEHLVIANFRGKGDRDLLLQATNTNGYRMGRYLSAYSIDDLMKKNNPDPLWTRDDFIACAHNGARVADLDNDGKDEVLGGNIIGPRGEMLTRIPLKGHIDAIHVADVRPDIPGLEVVALEEGGDKRFKNIYHVVYSVFNIYKRIIGIGEYTIGNFLNRIFWVKNRIFLYNHEGLIWETDYNQWEPQNAAIGEFLTDRPGLEIWCRSRFEEHQEPFIFDAYGRLIERYKMDVVAPMDWTVRGVEEISPVDWTGNSRQVAAAKERHKHGDIAIFDPISGEFLYRFKERADRLYVVDVVGDWREELVVLNGKELHIYQSEGPNPKPNAQRLSNQNHYKRSKMTWNYYSP
jgi:hypothetical protein